MNNPVVNMYYNLKPYQQACLGADKGEYTRDPETGAPMPEEEEGSGRNGYAFEQKDDLLNIIFEYGMRE